MVVATVVAGETDARVVVVPADALVVVAVVVESSSGTPSLLAAVVVVVVEDTTVVAFVVAVVAAAVVVDVVLAAAVVVVVVVCTSNGDAHTFQPSSVPLASLNHTSAAPVSSFTPSGPEPPLNSVLPTVRKSNPSSTAYCVVPTTSGRDATTLQFSSEPY